MLSAKARKLSPREAYAVNHTALEISPFLTSYPIYVAGAAGADRVDIARFAIDDEEETPGELRDRFAASVESFAGPEFLAGVWGIGADAELAVEDEFEHDCLCRVLRREGRRNQMGWRAEFTT